MAKDSTFWSVTVREDIEGGDFWPESSSLPSSRRKNDANVEMSQGAVKMMLMSGETLKLFIDSTCLSRPMGGCVNLERTKRGELSIGK